MYRCVSLLLLLGSTCHATTLFEDDEILDMTIEGPLSTMIADTEDRHEYSFALTTGKRVVNVAIRVRGISRVQRCRFPPLRLNFSSSDTSDTIFSGQEKLKLVTHCKALDEFEQNLLEEYAAYRIFNVLSDVSFRTRLLRIRYVDTDKPGDSDMVRHAFLIEPKNALAQRNGGSVVDARRVTKNYLDQRQVGLAYIFQFLIGNTDWALVRAIGEDVCCHNGILVGIEDRHFYVPYDFDRAGLVNARYAKPHPELRLSRVTQRLYRGYCMPSEELKDALHVVRNRRDDIIGVVEGLPHMSEKAIKSRAKYLQRFFDLAAKEDKLMREFERRCL